MADQTKTRGLVVALMGAGVPLDAISALWPGLQEASGNIVAEGAILGSLSDPQLDLHVSAKDAAFELESTGVAYDQVGFDLTVNPAAARLTGLHVRTSLPGSNPTRGGTIDGSLEAKLTGTTLGDWTGKVVYDRPLISATSDRLLRLSPGEVHLRGTPPNIVVDGDIAVEEARIRLDERFFGDHTDDKLPDWLHVNRAGQAPRTETPVVKDTGIPDWLDLSFGINLARNVFLHARLPLEDSLGTMLGAFSTVTLDTQADGQLQISAHGGALSVEGQVLPLRGTAALFGRPFEIRDDSTISFTGLDFASPILDLHAFYDTRGYGMVEAHITGIPDQMAVDLSSAEYPSQDDVISLLLVGRPASEVTASAGDTASSAALSMLLSTVGQELGNQGAQTAAMFITPDLLVIGSETARVGKRIGNRLFVIVDIDNTADDVKSSYLLVTVELALGGPWEGEFVHGTAGEDAIGVNWTRRY